MKLISSGDTRWQQRSVISFHFLVAGWTSQHTHSAHQWETAGSEFLLFKNRCVIFFFPLLLPWRSPCKDKSFDCWLETLSRAPRSLDKVSSAAQSKYCIEKKDIFGNASSYVQLCYLNELCGIIIRLMPVQDWLCGEVKETSPGSEIYPGLNQSSITFILSEMTCTSSAIKNRSRKRNKKDNGKDLLP